MAPQPRLIGEVKCTSQANATTILTFIQNRLTNLSRIAVANEEPFIVQRGDGQWYIVLDLRLSDKAATQLAATDIRDAWTSGANANRVAAGATVSFHMCQHADGVLGPCDDLVTREFVKYIK